MTRAIPFPMHLIDFPQVARLKAPQFGIFFRLIASFWNSGIPIPESLYERVALANSDLNTIQRNNEAVNNCLALVMPSLEAEYVQKLTVRATRQRTARYAGLCSRDKTRLKQKAISSLSDDKDTDMTVALGIPEPHVTQNTGKFDPHARAKAIKNSKENARNPDKRTLTDD